MDGAGKGVKNFHLNRVFDLFLDKAQQGSSLGPSTTQSTLEVMRYSRNGTIRSGTLPTVQMYVFLYGIKYC